VVLTCIAANIAISPLIYLMLDRMILVMCRFEWFNRLYTRYKERVINRLRVRIEKYGLWGLAVFIGIPLPGSGVYSGAVGAHALGIKLKDYLWAAAIGVIIAGTAVTAVTMTGSGLFSIFIKQPL
jgi:uncharacterized membrane protein